MIMKILAVFNSVAALQMGSLWSKERLDRVWITGASSGLGEAMAYELAATKARLVLSARREDRLRTVAAKCEALGAQCAVVRMDQADMNDEIDRAIAAYGGLDMAVINGGVSSRGLALETDLATLRRITEINFLSSAEIGRRVAQHMIDNGIPGRLLVVSSVSPASFGFSEEFFRVF